MEQHHRLNTSTGPIYTQLEKWSTWPNVVFPFHLSQKSTFSFPGFVRSLPFSYFPYCPLPFVNLIVTSILLAVYVAISWDISTVQSKLGIFVAFLAQFALTLCSSLQSSHTSFQPFLTIVYVTFDNHILCCNFQYREYLPVFECRCQNSSRKPICVKSTIRLFQLVQHKLKLSLEKCFHSFPVLHTTLFTFCSVKTSLLIRTRCHFNWLGFACHLFHCSLVNRFTAVWNRGLGIRKLRIVV